MKNLIFKIFRWIAGMIGVTVAASCDSVDDLISAPEYGVPYAAFEVKCKVVDSVTGNPVKGVKMTPGFTYSYGNMSGFQQSGLSSEISDGVFEITGHQDIGSTIFRAFWKMQESQTLKRRRCSRRLTAAYYIKVRLLHS